MRSHLSILGSAFVIGFSGAVVPGPMLAATIASVPTYGLWAGPLVVLGHGVTEAAVIAALAAGLGAWLSRDRVLACVGVLGGAALIAFGWLTLMAARTVSLAAGDAPGFTMHPVVAGVVTAVVNPYWLFWWATIGVSYVAMSVRRGVTGLCVFGVGHVMADLVWFTLVSTALALGRSLMGGAGFRFIVAACGVGLILFGIRFVWSGAMRWRSVKPDVSGAAHDGDGHDP